MNQCPVSQHDTEPNTVNTHTWYTDQQIANLHQSCWCDTDSSESSVLGVDCTFNLGRCYVTAVVFASWAVIRNDTYGDDHHWLYVSTPAVQHGCYMTYVECWPIFSHLQSTLDSAVANTKLRLSINIIIGSNEEKGLTKATRFFPRYHTPSVCHTVEGQHHRLHVQ